MGRDTFDTALEAKNLAVELPAHKLGPRAARSPSVFSSSHLAQLTCQINSVQANSVATKSNKSRHSVDLNKAHPYFVIHSGERNSVGPGSQIE